MSYGTAILFTAFLVGACAQAQAQVVRFDGALVALSSTGTCASPGGVTRHAKAAKYYPASVGSNNNFSSIVMIGPFNGDVIATESGPFSSSYQSLTAVGTGNMSYTYPVEILISDQQPATITTETRSVTVVGSIKNYDESGPACVTSFRAAFTRRLN